MKEIYLEFAIDVVKFVFIFTVVRFEVLLINFFQVMKIIRTFWIYVFMNDEMLPVFLRNESVTTVRTSKLHGRKTAFVRREPGVTDFAEKLSFGTIILVKEGFRSITTRTATAVRDITGRMTADGKDFFAIAFFVVRDKVFVSPVLPVVRDQRKFIDFEFLVFGRMRIIKSPLLERNVSTDKI